MLRDAGQHPEIEEMASHYRVRLIGQKFCVTVILREEFLVRLQLTSYAVAAALHVPHTRIERIARKEEPMMADTPLRLGKFFKTGAAFWMNIQASS